MQDPGLGMSSVASRDKLLLSTSASPRWSLAKGDHAPIRIVGSTGSNSVAKLAVSQSGSSTLLTPVG